MLFCMLLTVLVLVLTDTGGMSCFSSMQSGWENNKTWVLPGTVQLPSDLEAHHDKDNGDHWLICPSTAMPYETFVDRLKELNALATRYDIWLQNK